MKLIEEQILQKVIQKRPATGFKGTFGKVLVVGGNANMGGAALMSGSAAVHAGVGLVTIATSKENLTAIHVALPEAMAINYWDKVSFVESIEKTDVIVVGPGLGTDLHAQEILKIVLSNVGIQQTLIIDGSAITMIAENHDLLEILPKSNLIFTPHQMEWQRLSRIKIVDQENIQLNQQVQQSLNATVILKKHHTQIYFKNKEVFKLTIGGPYMATGGMGDTLTGILAAFIAQFKTKDTNEAIQAAVYTHSKIADELSSKKYVVLPSDIINNLQPFMRKQIKD
ncbi:NAD(P)H-hydrate dehydratase [Ligilactobacillus sp. LYQ135]